MEADFRKWLVRVLAEDNWYAQSIEVMFGLGTPDVYAIKDGIPIWIEGKQLHGGAPDQIRGTQLAWMEKHRRVGKGQSILMIEDALVKCVRIFPDYVLIRHIDELIAKNTNFYIPKNFNHEGCVCVDKNKNNIKREMEVLLQKYKEEYNARQFM